MVYSYFSFRKCDLVPLLWKKIKWICFLHPSKRSFSTAIYQVQVHLRLGQPQP